MSMENGRIERIQKMLEHNMRVLPRGGGTKSALSTPARDEKTLDMAGFSGMIEYIPEEFTFTAFAGTPLTEVVQILNDHGQYLPFDPPMVKRGATLGGTVASGLSGSGRYRFGGVRDFILGVRFIDGRGDLISAGGKVVKNVAGYDFPKLMVGSIGGLGILVELSFKVFPRPQAYATWHRSFGSLEEALQMMKRASMAQIPLEALDLHAQNPGYSLSLRISGIFSVLPSRIGRLLEIIGEGQLLEDKDDEQFWYQVREFSWVPEGHTLIKVALTPRSIPALESYLDGKPVLRRYTAGGQLAWIALDDTPHVLEPVLKENGLSGLVIWGPPGFPHLGELRGISFLRRVKESLDPAFRFTEV
jgi:glycolate oxidase FAD binding subunit